MLVACNSSVHAPGLLRTEVMMAAEAARRPQELHHLHSLASGVYMGPFLLGSQHEPTANKNAKYETRIPVFCAHEVFEAKPSEKSYVFME
jgi:hypothetical protein